MDEPGIYADCQFAAMTVLRAAGTGGDDFAESDIPRDGTMAVTVSTRVQRYGSLAYLGMVAALTRLAISGIAGGPRQQSIIRGRTQPLSFRARPTR